MSNEIETATWCAMREAYADEFCEGSAVPHVHYDIEYDGTTGTVLTSAEEQARRHYAAAAGVFVWSALAVDLQRLVVEHDLLTAEDVMGHPAMKEILRRAREAAWFEGVTSDDADSNPYRFQKQES